MTRNLWDLLIKQKEASQFLGDVFTELAQKKRAKYERVVENQKLSLGRYGDHVVNAISETVQLLT